MENTDAPQIIMDKFADNTKVAQIMRGEEDRIVLQKTLDSCLSWSVKWGMEVNVSKCKVINVGRK